MDTPSSHSDLIVDVEEKPDDEEMSPLSDISSGSASTLQTVPQTYKSTVTNGFGKIISKIPGAPRPNVLKERSTNLLPKD